MVYDEDTLYTKIANSILKEGKRLSPLVDATLKDMRHYYLLTDLELVNIQAKQLNPQKSLFF